MIGQVLPIEDMKNSLGDLKKNMLASVSDTVKSQLNVLKGSMLSPGVLSFLKNVEPYIKKWKDKNASNPVFDFLLSPIDTNIQLAKDNATASILGKEVKDSSLKLEDLAVAQYPNEDKKIAIFKKFTVNEVDPMNIPINTGVSIKIDYLQYLLKKETPFMTEYLKTTSMVHFIPDPSVKKIKVLHPQKTTELYERKEISGKLEFVSVTSGNVLKLNEVAGFNVIEKETGIQLETAISYKQLDETNRIMTSEANGKELVFNGKKVNLTPQFLVSLDFKNAKAQCANFVRTVLGLNDSNKKLKSTNLLWVPDLVPELVAHGGVHDTNMSSVHKKIEKGLKPGTVVVFNNSYAGSQDHVAIIGEDGQLYDYGIENGQRHGRKAKFNISALSNPKLKGSSQTHVEGIIEFA